MSGRRHAFAQRARVFAVALVALSLLAAAPTDPTRRLKDADDAMDSARALIARGETTTAKKRLDEAGKIYRDVLRQSPEQREAALGLSGVLFLEKRFDDGVALLRPFHDRLPDDVDVTHQLGLHLYRSGEQQNAVPLLEVAAKDPQRFDASWLLVQHYYRVADWEAGLVHAERYLTARPDDTEALALIGTYYLKAEQYDRAVATLDRYLAAYPDNVPARVNRANALFRKGQIDRAGEEYERLLREQPDRSRFLYNLASVRMKQSRCDEALGLLDRFLVSEPKNGPALYFRADCLLKLGRFDDAQAAFERAGTDGESKNPWVWYGLSRVALKRGQRDLAVTNAKKAVDLASGEAELAAWLGTVYRKAGRPAEAVGWHDRAIGLDPGAAAYQVEKGYDLWALERADEALGAFTKALELDAAAIGASQGIAAAKTALGNAAWKAGESDKAASLLSEAMRADPNTAVARANFAVVKAASGKVDEARAALDQAPAEAKKHPDIGAASALVALLDGRFDEARTLATAARAGNTQLVGVVAQVEGQVAAKKGDWDLAAKAFDEALQLAPSAALEQARAQSYLELGLERLGRGDGGGARDALGKANRAAARLDPDDRQTLEFALAAMGILTADPPEGAAKALAATLGGARYQAASWARVRDIGHGYVAYGWLRAGNTAEARKALDKVRDRTALGAAWDALVTSADDVEARRAFAGGDFAGAERIWSAVAQRGAKDPALDNNLAAARFMLGRAAEAEPVWKVLVDSGAPAEALYNLGNALGRKGDHKGAWELFKRYGQTTAPQAERIRERADVKARLFGFGQGGTP
ncbi:MAG: tetratricopeptide repeat protein [Deltaproteobacteria bacterium]|nr:tetratricopeptide repeat protein [Deltaproteobacteria bacterium]